jgi:hypothetical protein
MIRRSFVLGAAGLSLTLAGCGGGSSTPTPTPTPTSTATPTPTASPTYASFPLAAPAEFGTVDAFTSYTGTFGTGPVVLGAAGTEVGTTRYRVALQPTPTAASTSLPVVIRENTDETRYIASELTVTPTPTVTEYAFTKVATATTPTATSEFLNNTAAGPTGTSVVTNDPVLNLTRTSYASYIRTSYTPTAGGAAVPGRLAYGVFGYPTVFADLPASGTVTYTAKLSGRILRAMATGPGLENKLSGTVTVTVNFSTGIVDTTLTVNQIGAGGATTPLGVFSGTGAIAGGQTQFTGSFGPTSPISGTFAGAFFGSQGAEIGISFAASGSTTQGGNTYDTRALGVVVGKKS